MTISSFVRATILAVLVTHAAILNAQQTKDTTARDATTDVHYHKFLPAITPGASDDSGVTRTQTELDTLVGQQIALFQQEKAARTPAQQKIDSNVLYTIRMMRGQQPVPGIPSLYTGVDLDDKSNVAVEMVAKVTDDLLRQLTDAGAQVLYSSVELRSIRAIIPPDNIEGIASSSDVIFIYPKQDPMAHGRNPATLPSASIRANLAPSFPERVAKVRRELEPMFATQSTPGKPVTGQGSVETEGDFTHRAVDARGTFGVNGAGLKIGVLSDGVTSRALSQTTGDLPPSCPATPACLTVLAGQAGAGDEGTALLEIIHDMAPGANLFFATADNSITSFAQNIRTLRFTDHCDIIVDDVQYFVESPFQDGQTSGVVSTSQGGVVTQAVNDVVADGALYLTAAGNYGNLDSNTSGTYEGDFVPQATASPLPTGNVHNFGGGIGYDKITAPGQQVVGLWWADPLGGSGNDYDLYLLNSTGASILGASTNIQNGTQDPVELIGSANVINNNRLVVFQHTGAANRFLHLELFAGTLAVSTSGATHGHSAASGAYTVASTPAAVPNNSHTPTGPFPNPFNVSDQIETSSSDGLRRIFFQADSTPITSGNFSSTGGTVLNKPDITAADGVSVTGVGGRGSPFYGTSAAVASATGVVALVKSAQPSATAAQIRTALTSTAVDIMGAGFDRDSGNGIVMAWEALHALGVTANANPELGTIAATENPGNGNGIIEAGEGARLVIALNNSSGVNPMTGITATLASSTTGVIVTQPGTSSYADILAGGSGGNNLSPFTFTLASNFPCAQLIHFTLTVDYTGGPERVLNFTVQPGLLTITNTLGTLPTAPSPITTATGAQVNRINRNGVISSCTTPKAFPGAITGSHTFDSYSFTACQTFCLKPGLDAGAAGINLFEAVYSPSYTPTSIGTHYAGDAGLSSNLQSFGIAATVGTPYTLVVSDVAGNPLSPTAPPNTYTIQIPSCAFSCNVNQLPVAIVQNVTVTAATLGGSANANINNGSFDPEGGTLTLTQNPPGPYPQGVTTVILTAIDPLGAASQASATVTVTEPTPPSAHLAANTLTFSAQNVSSSSAAQSDMIANSGQAPLHFSVAPAITGANASDFAVVSGTTCTTATPVSGSGTCVLNITFTPTAAGSRTAALTLTDDATPATQTVILTGIGTLTPATADLAANTLTFSAQTLSSPSTAQNATVTNHGEASLHFSVAATITGTNASDFAVASGTTCTTATPVPGSGTCAVKVTFTPTASGSRTATLTLTDDATPTTQTVTLHGTGSDFTVSGPSTVVAVAAGQTAIFPITVTAGTGGFPQTVTFSQTGAPTTGTIISFNPTSASPGSTSASTTLTITTAWRTLAGGVLVVPGSPSPLGRLPMLLWVAATVLLATDLSLGCHIWRLGRHCSVSCSGSCGMQ
jgi:hypothetical protein